MIKTEDLRIGDLVRVCCDCAFPKGYVCIVHLIYLEDTDEGKKGDVILRGADGTYDGSCRVCCSNIEAIPLAPEILKKNGWRLKVEYSRTYTHESHRLEVEFPIDGEYAYVYIGSSRLLGIKYIHELQHILWVLGMDIKFKI